MSNRYLFRGKRVDGIWVYGNLMMSERDRVKIQYSVGEGGYKDWISEYVIPETVGQSTGLTDKNGKMVFEGDLVDSNYFKKATVVFWNNGWHFNVNDGHHSFNTAIHSFEVIGSIHD